MDTLTKITAGLVAFDAALFLALYNRPEAKKVRSFVLLRLGVPGPTFLISSDPQPRWTSNIEEATTWPSEHAAQLARSWRGMDPEDVLMMEVR